MSEPGSPQNGERLQFQLGSKAFGVTTRDLLPILLLVSGLVGGYLLYIGVTVQLNLLYTRQDKILEYLKTHQERATEGLAQMHDALEQETTAIARMLEVLQYNRDRPREEWFPLHVAPQQLPGRHKAPR